MIEFWISWKHQDGSGHSSVPASPFQSAKERREALGWNTGWPAGHVPSQCWETRDGTVIETEH